MRRTDRSKPRLRGVEPGNELCWAMTVTHIVVRLAFIIHWKYNGINYRRLWLIRYTLPLILYSWPSISSNCLFFNLYLINSFNYWKNLQFTFCFVLFIFFYPCDKFYCHTFFYYLFLFLFHGTWVKLIIIWINNPDCYFKSNDTKLFFWVRKRGVVPHWWNVGVLADAVDREWPISIL